MNILFINMFHDAAACSVKQCAAINKYTPHKARHFRAIKTFYPDLDIGPENYNKDEFLSLVREADVIEFCSAEHQRQAEGEEASGFSFGFNWVDETKRSTLIYHDYNSFLGRWSERAKAKDLWNKRKEINYDAIFSSIPQAKYIYDGCVYVPDIVDEQLPIYSPGPERNYSNLFIGHFPTGEGNNKNTDEFQRATRGLPTLVRKNIHNNVVLLLKRSINLAFDALWRGFHGMTTVENLAMGIPTMCGTDPEFVEIFKAYHQCDDFPIDITNSEQAIKDTATMYAKDMGLLGKRSQEVRAFMENHWSSKIIANNIIKEYEKL